MNIKKFKFNPVEVNAIVLWDETLECVIIDPACFYPEEEQQLKSFIETQNLKPVRLLNTHGHFDHLMGNGFVEKTWGIKSEIHKEDNYLVEQASGQSLLFGMSMPKPPLPGWFFEDGEILTFGNSSLKVIYVPGHSPGGVAFYSEADKLLIAGDILFSGSVGRTDLPKGNHEQLITGIKEKLMVLDPQIKVYCGHGPETTIGTEKSFNPFLT
ncbi:MAG TPA: MBL fold metallo-hydrolase [Prolixibacteraceae bacterium]|jgi:glyoxylase-like metal-dependent hydrolase (beta-lactamase superfamily II)